MWRPIAKEMEISWEEAEEMHWLMANQAGVAPFSVSCKLPKLAMVYERFVLPPPVLVDRGWWWWCLGV
jgi:hypothetical protein